MSKWFTTISIEDEVLALIKETDVNHHGIEMKTNSDKLKAMILAYRNK